MDRRAFLKAGASLLAGVAMPALALANGEEPYVVHGIDRSAAAAPVAQQAPVPAGISPIQGQSGDWRAFLLNRPRELWVRRQSTGEETKVLYWLPDRGYLQDGYGQLCTLLRDVQANRVMSMDPRLLDVLTGLQYWLRYHGYQQKVVVLSGFRTERTNNHTEGAGRNSRHLTGQAADILIPGVPAGVLGQMGLMFQQGGVGFYPGKGFTHIDTGPLRAWRG